MCTRVIQVETFWPQPSLLPNNAIVSWPWCRWGTNVITGRRGTNMHSGIPDKPVSGYVSNMRWRGGPFELQMSNGSYNNKHNLQQQSAIQNNKNCLLQHTALELSYCPPETKHDILSNLALPPQASHCFALRSNVFTFHQSGTCLLLTMFTYWAVPDLRTELLGCSRNNPATGPTIHAAFTMLFLITCRDTRIVNHKGFHKTDMRVSTAVRYGNGCNTGVFRIRGSRSKGVILQNALWDSFNYIPTLFSDADFEILLQF